ncbi:hypothetical protein RCL1_001684 [Eukaryota sp. TZLM3-RCL]
MSTLPIFSTSSLVLSVVSIITSGFLAFFLKRSVSFFRLRRITIGLLNAIAITVSLSMFFISPGDIISDSLFKFFFFTLFLDAFLLCFYYFLSRNFLSLFLTIISFIYSFFLLKSALSVSFLTIFFIIPQLVFFILFQISRQKISLRSVHIFVFLFSIVVFLLRVSLFDQALHPIYPAEGIIQQYELISLLGVPFIITRNYTSSILFSVMFVASIVLLFIGKTVGSIYDVIECRFLIARQHKTILESEQEEDPEFVPQEDEDSTEEDMEDEEESEEDGQGMIVDQVEASLTMIEAQTSVNIPPSNFLRGVTWFTVFLAGPTARFYSILDLQV